MKKTIVILLVCLFIIGCSKEKKHPSTKQSQPTSKWEIKIKNYPLKLTWKKQHIKEPYNFSRRKILERIVNKLTGGTSKECFDNIRELFGRLPKDEVIPLLIDYMENLFDQGIHMRAVLQNACEAAGYVKDKRLVEVLMKAATLPYPHSSTLLHPGVERAAIISIGACAEKDQAKMLWEWFYKGKLDNKGKMHLLNQLAHIDPDLFIENIEKLLASESLGKIFESSIIYACSQIVNNKNAKKLANILSKHFNYISPMDKLTVAAILHQGGIMQGTFFLRKKLKEFDKVGGGEIKAMIISMLSKAPGEKTLQEILQYSNDPSPKVRFAVAKIIENKKGQEIDNVLEVLAEDKDPDVRRAALAALYKRGKTSTLELKMDMIREETGTKRFEAIKDLLEVGYPPLGEVAGEEALKATGREKFLWIRVLGLTPGKKSFDALLKIFKSKNEKIASDIDSIQYSALMMSNHPEGFEDLKKAYTDLINDNIRRPHILATIARFLGLDEKILDKKNKEKIKEYLFKVIGDPNADPLDRVYLLRAMLRSIGFKDILKLKRMLRKIKNPFVWQGLNDFLWEFF